jgi:hypothetical protein
VSEVWRPTVGRFSGWPYEVSSEGRVRSVDRVTTRVDGITARFRGRILRQSQNENGYLTVGLCLNGKQVTVDVHVLICDAFNGKSDLPEVNHEDGNKLNNLPRNLMRCTKLYNVQHAWRTGLNVALQGQRNGRAKLTDVQAAEVRRRSRAGESAVAIARDFSISWQTVSAIRRGDKWTHLAEAC